ncbi:hypothetical protein [Terribacillus sp. DMT04]|uniref:hypothetical protein n=1 Tax=Terribacillus sp. DMT04 TaxID=2850441 RepID=UPI001C2CB03B|nr:hypothetical protein [Terribacillus sp. DMT04]QXE02294.1 hypothetical protein KS242_03420 [Terribacillus sp. DMT04]
MKLLTEWVMEKRVIILPAIKIVIEGKWITFTKSNKDNHILENGRVIVTSHLDSYRIESMEGNDINIFTDSLKDAYYEAMKILLIR